MKKLFKIIILLAPLTGLGMWTGNAYAATCTSIATGNWNAAGTWSCVPVGPAFPTAADDVVIANLAAAHTVTVNVPSAALSVTFTAGNKSSTLTLASTLAVTGAITVNGPTGGAAVKTLNVGANTLSAASILIAGGAAAGQAATVTVSTGTITTTGSITFSGTATDATLSSTGASTINVGGDLGSGGTLTTGGTGTINFNGNVAAQSMGAYLTYNNVNIANTNGAGVVSLLGAASMTGALTVASGTLNTSTFALGVAGNLTVNSAISGTTGAITLSGAGTTIGGTGSITTTTGALTIPAAKTILATANLAIASPIAITAAVAITNNGTITSTSASGITGIVGSTWVNAAGSTLNVAGPLLAAGTLTANAAVNTVNYTGAAQTVNPTAYYHLGLSGSGAKTMTGVTAIGGNLSISGTATMTANSAFTVTGALSYSSTGATTLAAATPISIGSYNQSAGTLIDNGNIITVTGTGAGTWTQSGGTFTPTGEVIFTGAAPQIGASNFNNLTINSGGGATLTGNATLSGTLTLTSGTLAVGANTLTLNGPAIAGTSTSLVTTASSSLSFGGSSIGVFVPANVTALNNLTVNNINGITLNSSPALSGTLTLTSGTITTGANILEASSSCATAISGGSATSYVLGNLRLHYPVNAGTTTCTFHIGDAAAYTPATVAMTNVTSTLANSSLTARTDTGDHADTTAGASGIVAAKSVNRYWTLTPGVSLTFATYNATFTFVAGDIDGGAVAANFIIGRKNGTSWAYPLMGAKNALDTTATGMTQAGGFGEFVIGERIMPSTTMLKTVAIYSDPVNLLVNPKYIPGAVAEYAVIASNSGGPADNDTTFITDAVPANTALYVNDIGGAGSGPALFTQGASSSTLTYTFTALNSNADDLFFSNDGGATWDAVPIADIFGCDATVPAITHIRINPKGTFVGSAVAPNPSFQLAFRVCVK